MVGSAHDQDQAEGEKGGEDNAHGRAFFHSSEPVDPVDKEGGQDSHRGGSDEHGKAVAAVGEKKGQGQPGQHGVTDGVAHHAHFSEHQKAPGNGTGKGAEDSGDDDPGIQAGPGHEEALLSIGCGLDSLGAAFCSSLRSSSSRLMVAGSRTCSTRSASRSTWLGAMSA